jgi:molecular chaperone GrpE
LQTLDCFGVRRIDALGQRFDPSLHEVMMDVDDPSQPPGTVIRVVEHGYTIHDRLLGPARVIVSKRHARAKPEIDDSDLGAEWASHSVNHQ